uniref:Uncharacterized protein n=1 Tax=Trepomonas sp. PC1 TaxID=1076344 RepID=A0A146JWX7_9EUKA|eukprot:JAP89140.1 Hypothetical protein TPC1_31365 [Trepomonas sp. PC1]
MRDKNTLVSTISFNEVFQQLKSVLESFQNGLFIKESVSNFSLFVETFPDIDLVVSETGVKFSWLFDGKQLDLSVLESFSAVVYNYCISIVNKTPFEAYFRLHNLPDQIFARLFPATKHQISQLKEVATIFYILQNLTPESVEFALQKSFKLPIVVEQQNLTHIRDTLRFITKKMPPSKPQNPLLSQDTTDLYFGFAARQKFRFCQEKELRGQILGQSQIFDHCFQEFTFDLESFQTSLAQLKSCLRAETSQTEQIIQQVQNFQRKVETFRKLCKNDFLALEAPSVLEKTRFHENKSNLAAEIQVLLRKGAEGLKEEFEVIKMNVERAVKFAGQ